MSLWDIHPFGKITKKGQYMKNKVVIVLEKDINAESLLEEIKHLTLIGQTVVLSFQKIEILDIYTCSTALFVLGHLDEDTIDKYITLEGFQSEEDRKFFHTTRENIKRYFDNKESYDKAWIELDEWNQI
jgi:hypothetical protein